MLTTIEKSSFDIIFEENNHSKKELELIKNNLLDIKGFTEDLTKELNSYNLRLTKNFNIIMIDIYKIHFKYKINTLYYSSANKVKRRNSIAKIDTSLKKMLIEKNINFEIIKLNLNGQKNKYLAYNKIDEEIVFECLKEILIETFCPYLERQNLNEIANNIKTTMTSRKYIL